MARYWKNHQGDFVMQAHQEEAYEDTVRRDEKKDIWWPMNCKRCSHTVLYREKTGYRWGLTQLGSPDLSIGCMRCINTWYWTSGFESRRKGPESIKGPGDCKIKLFQSKTKKYACVSQWNQAKILVKCEVSKILQQQTIKVTKVEWALNSTKDTRAQLVYRQCIWGPTEW